MKSSASKTYSSVKEALEALDHYPAIRSVAIALSASPAPTTVVDAAGLTRGELRRLRAEDPFQYHSLPAVRRRRYRFQDDDEADDEEADDAAHDGAPPRRSSDPGRPRPPPQMVPRQRRLSVEAHPTLALDEMDFWDSAVGEEGDRATGRRQ